MRFELEPTRNLGLQHTLRNGIALLHGDLADDLRPKVLERLLSIVTLATTGAQALASQSVNFAPEGRRAIESFSLFHRYLGRASNDLPETLEVARVTLHHLDKAEPVEQAAAQALETLLTALLAAIARERRFAPLVAPRNLHFH